MLDTTNVMELEKPHLLPCAQCGDALVAPQWSEHVSERCVRHVWSCEACGYQFETSIYLHARA